MAAQRGTSRRRLVCKTSGLRERSITARFLGESQVGSELGRLAGRAVACAEADDTRKTYAISASSAPVYIK